jgi:hypothetical protein
MSDDFGSFGQQPPLSDDPRSGGYRQRATYRVPTPRRVRSSDHRMHFGCLGLTLVAVIVLGLLGWWFTSYEYGTEHHETFTVTRLDDQSNGSSGHKYLVFGRLPDGTARVYQDTDAIFHGKMNSSDLYAQLQVGRTYNCNLYGVRNHLLSGYQDLLSCTEVKH